MNFRLVPKFVTLNDLEQRNGVILRYFNEFGQLPAPCVKVHVRYPDEFLFYIYSKTISSPKFENLAIFHGIKSPCWYRHVLASSFNYSWLTILPWSVTVICVVFRFQWARRTEQFATSPAPQQSVRRFRIGRFSQVGYVYRPADFCELNYHRTPDFL